MNISLLFLMLLSSFTGQVKAIYCFSALACIFTIRQFRHIFFLLWPSTFCSLLLSFYHQFPDLLGSPASVNLTLGAMRDPKLLLLFLCVGLTDRTVEGDQLGVNSAAAKWRRSFLGSSWTAWRSQKCTGLFFFSLFLFFVSRACPLPKGCARCRKTLLTYWSKHQCLL